MLSHGELSSKTTQDFERLSGRLVEVDRVAALEVLPEGVPLEDRVAAVASAVPFPPTSLLPPLPILRVNHTPYAFHTFAPPLSVLFALYDNWPMDL